MSFRTNFYLLYFLLYTKQLAVASIIILSEKCDETETTNSDLFPLLWLFIGYY